ncbi:MAG: OmpA family protein [Candidatus Competibacterales bacterium]
MINNIRFALSAAALFGLMAVALSVAHAEEPFFPKSASEIEALLSQSPKGAGTRVRGLGAIVADPKDSVQQTALRPKATAAAPAPTPRQEVDSYRQLVEQAPKANALVHFDVNSARLRPDTYSLLNEYAKALKSPRLGEATIVIAGHTDDTGSEAYNRQLSVQRATAVKQYLVNRGVDSRRLVVKGYGEAQPLVPNTSNSNRALNRRSEFIRVDGLL